MSSPIKLGIVGLGRAGWGMHCAELAGREDKFQFVAACDLIPERRARMAERYGCAVYEDIEALIADPAVEMVDIATRSIDHYAHARLALEAGKDVFLEKPMCVSYEQAYRLQDLATDSPGNLYVRHNRRFEPAFQHIHEIIDAGLLGKVFEIKLRRVGYSRRDDWQTLREFGGGQLLNWGPHIVDHGLRLLDSTFAGMWCDLQQIAAAGDAEDHLKIILYGTNGRMVDLEISGGAALGEPEYRVWGSRGALTCQGEQEIHLHYLDPNQPLSERCADPGTPEDGFGSPDELPWIEETIPVNPQLPVSMDGIWDHLYAAVREGVPFPIDLGEAVQTMLVLTAARENTPFQLPED